MDKEHLYLEAKSELQAMIDKKKNENEGLRNFDVWTLREKTNKARNAWRAEQRKLIMVSEPELREQIAKEIEMCHELRMAFANLNKCSLGECSHIEDAQIVRGQK